MNFYNENNPFAAEWLRQLIQANMIASGIVDERSIEDIQPEELREFKQCHFFAGIGVWSYALRRAGWPDDRPVWTGSCPCQPFSSAGQGKGFADERHLWPSWFHLISQCKPDTVFGEQVEAAIRTGWLDLVQNDLEGVGYALGATPFPACSVGAPHIRQRIYFCSTNPHGKRLSRRDEPRAFGKEEVASAWSKFSRVHAASSWKLREAQSSIRVFDDGSTNRVGRLRGYGNAIVAPQAIVFIESFCKIALDNE